jgi:hypothetical protein
MNINTRVNLMFPPEKNLVYNNFVMIKDKYMKKIQMTLLTALTFLMMCSASWAATYYIDGTNGNDTKSGSQSAPWKTIGKANSTLRAGDTVYIKKGTYKQTIRPSRSGEKGSYITYARNGNDEVIITGVSDGVNLVNRKYVIIDGLKILNVSGEWVDMRPNGCHNIIMNCYMKNAGSYKGIQIRDGANYNKILNNTLIGECSPADLIQVWNSSHNLIDGNDCYYGPHDTISVRGIDKSYSNKYNIIRNNYVYNKWHSCINIRGVEFILCENNIVVDGGDSYKTSPCGTSRDKSMARKEHKGISAGTKHSIYRNNVLVNNGFGFGLSSKGNDDWRGNCENNRFYNNTINKNIKGIKCSEMGYPILDNVLKNNIFFNNNEHEIYISSKANSKNIYVSNNIIGSSVKYGSNDRVIDGLAVNPQFINERDRNFRLRENSPMRDAGSFLSKTVNSGNGTVIKVEDARYFCDGWGIMHGDLIQLEGQSKTARIIKVDYSSNTITISDNLEWSAGKGISLPYNGKTPDIGAFEFNHNSTMRSPKNLRITLIE